MPHPVVQSSWQQDDCWIDSYSKIAVEAAIHLVWDVRVLVVVVDDDVAAWQLRKTHPKPLSYSLYFFVSFRDYQMPSVACSFAVVVTNFVTADSLQLLLD